jgi:hypothetical protein
MVCLTHLAIGVRLRESVCCVEGRQANQSGVLSELRFCVLIRHNDVAEPLVCPDKSWHFILSGCAIGPAIIL